MPPSETASNAITPVRIGPHAVGPGRRVLVVAEAGVNHDGSVERALSLVDAAVEAGADAVKFQMFRADELVTASAPMAAYQQKACGTTSQREMLTKLELAFESFACLRDYCDRKGALFFATPFSVADVDRLVKLSVPAIKIASTDLTNPVLLRAAVDTGLPMIVSTGASSEEEIRSNVSRLLTSGAAGRLVLLHCVSCYPTPLHAANLRAVATLARTSGVPTGFSDHTTSTQTGGWAVCAGACILEKHLTLDRAAAGPDHAMSLDPDSFRVYVENVRLAETALGTSELGMSDLERPVREVAGRSIVSRCGITRGTVLQAGSLDVKRPGGGIEPGRLEELLGRRAAVDIPADTVLSWEMIE
jgi:N,N'-diacetyllegionaminate synthase